MSESISEEVKNEDIVHLSSISKYNSTAQRCVDSCLNYGEIRYVNTNGSLMKVEIPYDKYDEAVRDIEQRVISAEINQEIKIEDVVEIFKKGNISYTQAKNLAKENKIEGISYYSIDGSIENESILGLSGMVEYALGIWNGLSKDEALIKGITRAMNVFDTYFIDCLKINDEEKKEEYKRFVKTVNHTMSREEELNKCYTIGLSYKNMYNGINTKNNKGSSLVSTSEIVGSITNAIFSTTDMNNVLLGNTSGKSFIK